MSDKEYPLFPELSESAQEEAIALIERFKQAMRKAAEDVIGDLYADVMPYIESDAWTNFRNELLDGFKDYGNRKIQSEYDFKTIRQEILKHHREEIINDLNQDLLERIAVLEKLLDNEQRSRRY